MVANGGETGAHLRIPFTEGTTVIVVREMERVVISKTLGGLRLHRWDASTLHPHDMGQSFSPSTATQGRGEGWAFFPLGGQQEQAVPQRGRHLAPE